MLVADAFFPLRCLSFPIRWRWGISILIDEAATDSEAEKIVAIDLTRSEQVRRWWPFLRDRRIDAYQNILKRFDD